MSAAGSLLRLLVCWAARVGSLLAAATTPFRLLVGGGDGGGDCSSSSFVRVVVDVGVAVVVVVVVVFWCRRVVTEIDHNQQGSHRWVGPPWQDTAESSIHCILHSDHRSLVDALVAGESSRRTHTVDDAGHRGVSRPRDPNRLVSTYLATLVANADRHHGSFVLALCLWDEAVVHKRCI